MRSLQVLVWILPLMLLAGCAQLDDAKEAAADAQAKIDEAKREAQEAKDRLDRVRSATIVREEHLRVLVVPMRSESEVWFDAEAYRGEDLIPQENVTSLPAIRIRFGDANLTCDPLDCRFVLPSMSVNVTWADGTEGGVTLPDPHAVCAPENAVASDCRLGELSRERALVMVTTAAGDVTD